MRKFQDIFETLKRSFKRGITVPLSFAKAQLLQKHYRTIFGTVRLQSYKIARRSIYDVFDSCSLH